MVKEKMDRINFLYRKSKAEGLTEEEKAEQAALRQEYIMEFRAQFTGIMENTVIKRPDGTVEKVSEKKKEKEKK